MTGIQSPANNPAPDSGALRSSLQQLGMPLPANTASRTVETSRALADSDNNQVLECLASVTLGLPAGLRPGFSCKVIPFGTTSIDPAPGVYLNGGVATLTRAAASLSLFEIVSRPAAVDSYALSGSAIAPTPVVPVAEFSGTPLTGTDPLTVTFTDASTNTPTSWAWEKNDGSGWVDFEGTPTVQNPDEDLIVGTWSIRLTATNAAGAGVETKADYVVVDA